MENQFIPQKCCNCNEAIIPDGPINAYLSAYVQKNSVRNIQYLSSFSTQQPHRFPSIGDLLNKGSEGQTLPFLNLKLDVNQISIVRELPKSASEDLGKTMVHFISNAPVISLNEIFYIECKKCGEQCAYQFDI